MCCFFWGGRSSRTNSLTQEFIGIVGLLCGDMPGRRPSPAAQELRLKAPGDPQQQCITHAKDHDLASQQADAQCLRF